MPAQAAQALQATPEASLVLVGCDLPALLERFEHAIQSILESPLDAGRVQEWTSLRVGAATA